MVIFFAHCKDDYGTEYEKLCIEKIRSEYPGSIIIDPKDIWDKIPEEDKKEKKRKRDGKEMEKENFWILESKYFFPEIFRSDFMVATRCWTNKSYRGKYSGGVLAEIRYAQEIGKRILEFGE